MNHRLFIICGWLLVLSAQGLHAQERMRYREFELGSNLASVAKLTGAAVSEAKLIHQRPAVITDLEWRPRYFSAGVSPQTDPVDLMVFRFYDDQLFRVVVDYDRHRTEGMTEADMIEAITATYGLGSKPLPRARVAMPKYGVPDTPLAIWGDTEYSVTLLRVTYPETFRLIVSLTRLENLARTASAEAVRMDANEAPQREIARQKKEADDSLAAQEKAKAENKAVFRP
jgi:hypothetical protein